MWETGRPEIYCESSSFQENDRFERLAVVHKKSLVFEFVYTRMDQSENLNDIDSNLLISLTPKSGIKSHNPNYKYS